MIIKKIEYALKNAHYNKSIFHIQKEKLDIQFGTVFLQKGTRIPEKGFTKRANHEISIIQKGKIEMLNEDGSIKGYLKTGDVVYIKALEAQAGNVLEDTQLMYTLIK
jgi:signal-transduction protein with cAMP-binding, CBS, and nucleotidyltransferase domain